MGEVRLARFKRLSWDFKRLPEVLARLHFVIFAMLMLPKVALLLAAEMSSQHTLIRTITHFFRFIGFDEMKLN